MFTPDIQAFVDAIGPQMNIWHNTTRRGDTGAGHTCETILFGKGEDNKSEADFMGFECKSVLERSKNPRVRLMNFSGGGEGSLNDRFGKQSASRGYRSFTRSFRCNKPVTIGDHRLELVIEDNALALHVSDGAQYGDWPIEAAGRSLTTKIRDKITNLALIRYDKRFQGGEQQYRYTGVDFFTGLSVPRLITAFGAKRLAVEFRYTAPKDYGTSFNMSFRDISASWPEHTRVSWGDK